VRIVEDRHATAAALADVDLVRADAEGANGQQLRRSLQHPRGHLRLRTHAEHAYPVDFLRQFLLVERGRERLDFEAVCAERLRGGGADVFQKKGLHSFSYGNRAFISLS
jgi:hypothetical protein